MPATVTPRTFVAVSKSEAGAEREQTEEEEEEEEDDYMSMTIAEPTAPIQKETYTQRRLRKQREAEDRSRPKSKEELKIIEDAAREDALSKSLFDKKSKGLGMMARMGFKPGTALGKTEGARVEPVGIQMKDDRGGIGMDSEKKRKFREEFEGETKRVKAEEGEYRERVRKEREDAKLEGQIGGAMRVAERMAAEKEEGVPDEIDGKKRMVSSKPLDQINLLWRGLVRRREEKERDRRMRYDLHQSLSRLPTYDDPNEDEEDKRALGKDVVQNTLVEDLEEEDLELDAFNALEPTERLRQLVEHLRQEHNYCFWCKHTYLDMEMEGCPGLTEEEHD